MELKEKAEIVEIIAEDTEKEEQEVKKVKDILQQLIDFKNEDVEDKRIEEYRHSLNETEIKKLTRFARGLIDWCVY